MKEYFPVASCGKSPSQLSCEIQLSKLQEAPFNLQPNTLIIARAQAYNMIGWGAFSPVNLSGARIPASPPTIQDAPKVVDNNLDSITVTWLSVNGALSYELF